VGLAIAHYGQQEGAKLETLEQLATELGSSGTAGFATLERNWNSQRPPVANTWAWNFGQMWQAFVRLEQLLHKH